MCIVVTTGSADNLCGLYILLGNTNVSIIVIQTTDEFIDFATKNVCSLLNKLSINIPLYYDKVSYVVFTDYDQSISTTLAATVQGEYNIRDTSKLSTSPMPCIAFGCAETVSYLHDRGLITKVNILDPEIKLPFDVIKYNSESFTNDVLSKSRMIVMSSNFILSLIPDINNLSKLSNNHFPSITFAFYVIGFYK